MTNYERVKNSLARQPVDRLPWFDGPWGDTLKTWAEAGKWTEGDDLITAFDMCMRAGGGVRCVADLDFVEQILEETEETILKVNGNGATLRTHKQHASTPEHVDFKVKDREGWEKYIKPFLLEPDRRRIDPESYRRIKQQAREEQRYFFWCGAAPFEQIHPVCGHEYMCMGMALDPDWVKDMAMTYARLIVALQNILWEEEGLPDGVFYYEDMGFKHRPFMSPAMYEQLIQPAHALMFENAHAHGLKVMVHSCGFVEPLVPGLVAAGMDCLQAMEVKAGMDMPRICEQFGDRIAFCGNIDIIEIASNDRDRIRTECDKKIIPVMEAGSGYIVHSDHSIPPQVTPETLRFFFEYAGSLAKHYQAR